VLSQTILPLEYKRYKRNQQCHGTSSSILSSTTTKLNLGNCISTTARAWCRLDGDLHGYTSMECRNNDGQCVRGHARCTLVFLWRDATRAGSFPTLHLGTSYLSGINTNSSNILSYCIIQWRKLSSM
jgi:hypothetical protein